MMPVPCDRNQEWLPASSFSILIIDNINMGDIGMRIKKKEDTWVDSNQTDKSEKTTEGWVVLLTYSRASYHILSSKKDHFNAFKSTTT